MESHRGREQPRRSALAGNALSATEFQPPRLLRTAHLQSIVGSIPPRAWFTRRRAAAVTERQQPVLLDCGEGVRLQALHTPLLQARRAADGRRLAVLLHGWEGNVESPYVLSAAALLHSRGFPIVRLHLRDHGGTEALNRELFHSCRLPEVVGAMRALAALFPAARLYLGGFSLGGNFMLRVGSDPGAPEAIAGIVAVSPVLEPEATLTALERGLFVYRRYFVRRWSRSLRAKQRAWPDEHDFDTLLLRPELRYMTAELVRRCTRFESLADYLSGYAITGERLKSLRFRAHMLLAADDPIIPVNDSSRLAEPPLLTVHRFRHGGHCGFVDDLRGPSFADRFMLEQFEQMQQRSDS
jgi:predicted alpha/beta-fold hydrolase